QCRASSSPNLVTLPPAGMSLAIQGGHFSDADGSSSRAINKDDFDPLAGQLLGRRLQLVPSAAERFVGLSREGVDVYENVSVAAGGAGVVTEHHALQTQGLPLGLHPLGLLAGQLLGTEILLAVRTLPLHVPVSFLTCQPKVILFLKRDITAPETLLSSSAS